MIVYVQSRAEVCKALTSVGKVANISLCKLK